jgi:1,4-dihydroxy-2-naphthoyl-CoA hydrolase
MNRNPLPTPEQLMSKATGTLVDELDMEIVAVEEGRVEMSMPVTHRHLAPNHYLHGGAVAALADTACGMGAFAHLPEGAEAFTTIELKTNFLGTATIGSLRCIATPHHLGRTTQVWDADVVHVDTGKTIARFRCTQMVLWPKS